MRDAPLKWIPAAVKRWLEEIETDRNGLGRLAQTALEAIKSGHSNPIDIYKYAAGK